MDWETTRRLALFVKESLDFDEWWIRWVDLDAEERRMIVERQRLYDDIVDDLACHDFEVRFTDDGTLEIWEKVL